MTLAMPFVIPTIDDWGVGVRYLNWKKERKVRVISMGSHVPNEAEAKRLALESISRQGNLPPVIEACEARRYSAIGVTTLINRKAPFLAKVKL